MRPLGAQLPLAQERPLRTYSNCSHCEVNPWRSTTPINFAPSTASCSRKCKLRMRSFADRSAERCCNLLSETAAVPTPHHVRRHCLSHCSRSNRYWADENQQAIRQSQHARASLRNHNSQLVWIGLKLNRNPPQEVSQKRLHRLTHASPETGSP